MEEGLMKFREEIGEKVKYYRLGSGLTQKQLAEKIKVNVATISRIESGILLNIELLFKLSEVLEFHLLISPSENSNKK